LTTARTGDFSIACDGLDYEFAVPATCSTGCALIFDVHGATMDGDEQDRATNIREIGNRAGYIVVNPSNRGTYWNMGIDHPKVHDMFLDAITTYRVNQNRTHITGFSQGGLMTWDFICYYPEDICSAAPIAASAQDSWTIWSAGKSNCFEGRVSPPNPPIDILYHSGESDGLSSFRYAEDQRDGVLEAYGMAGLGTLVSESRTHEWRRWVNAAGTTFEFGAHDSGHCMPTMGVGNGGGSGVFACDNEYNWGDAVVDFFTAHQCGR